MLELYITQGLYEFRVCTNCIQTSRSSKMFFMSSWMVNLKM